jgi:hypothetical protein
LGGHAIENRNDSTLEDEIVILPKLEKRRLDVLQDHDWGLFLDLVGEGTERFCVHPVAQTRDIA